MINKKAKLVENIFNTEDIQKEPTRNGFGRGLVEAGEQDQNVVAVCADLAESTRTHWFKEKFPERYVEVGVAEQNLATVASGMASYGKVPFIMSYAAFSPGRNNEQIRTTIALNDVPVKVVGCHAGLTVGPDGATHQALEDIGLMQMIPNMMVVVPSDAVEAQKATLQIAKTGKPAYLRLGRDKVETFTTEETPFEIGKAQIVYESEDPQITFVACGAMVYQSMLAAQELFEKERIGSIVVNMHTIKPLDKETLIECAKKTGRVVTAEEHQKIGGLGTTVAQVLSEHYPVPMRCVAVDDRFGQSGDPSELMREYGLTKEGILQKAKEIL